MEIPTLNWPTDQSVSYATFRYSMYYRRLKNNLFIDNEKFKLYVHMCEIANAYVHESDAAEKTLRLGSYI